ncbi:MAG: 2OG-Fe(II) oxygenase [Chitinophagales bacterium]
MKVNHHHKYILTIDGFWSNDKCDEFIAQSESIGYEPAMVQTDSGQKIVEGVRNNQRILFTDEVLANEIWEGIKDYAIGNIGKSEAIGLNEMFRFYKYEPGQEFKKHRDQSYIRNEIESSYFTLMIYLNEDFEGGETTFKDVIIKPKKGSALIFFHDLEHEGTKLTSGKKYVLRTDIMYRFNE